MASYSNDVRQFLAYGLLKKFDRLEEAGIAFNFRSDHLYTAAFLQALEQLEKLDFSENDLELARRAQVFEEFVSTPMPGVNREYAAIISACIYWLSGYTANAFVITKAFAPQREDISVCRKIMFSIFERNIENIPTNDELGDSIRSYVTTGEPASLEKAIVVAKSREDEYLAAHNSEEFILSRFLSFIIDRLSHVSFWSTIQDLHSAPKEKLVNYLSVLERLRKPIIDLWPSQRIAIAKGLIDGKSSLVISAPTSSGKTKMTELAFANDLLSDDNRKCLYLAPFRALVSEVEGDIGDVFSNMGISVASLYGGADANEIEVELSEKARLIIATPEKISAVLKISDKQLDGFQTIVLDEGHLIDSISRGVSYEFQLAHLRSQLSEENRVIFLSAVLPNSDELANWLIGNHDQLAKTDWQPTSMRIGAITWPSNAPPRLTYRVETGQPLLEEFFVPRLFEQEVWSELNPQTNRQNRHRFPIQGDNASIAAAMAFQYSRVGQVIVYTRRPDWALLIANKMLERLGYEKSIDLELVNDGNRDELEEIALYFERRLGTDSTLAKSIRQGFAIHHGKVPQSLRSIVEDAFRRQVLRVLVATNTIAQGVNFPAKTLIVHSLPRSESRIRDFWNLAGRAGRASKETLGEVIILQTGNLPNASLNDFIEKRIENVNSKMFELVRRILNEYPSITQETLDTFTQVNTDWTSVVRTIDVQLLELMAEELSVEGDDDVDVIGTTFQNLFCVHQAQREDLPNSGAIQQGLRDLIDIRAKVVQELIPEVNNRIRFAKTGLDIESTLFLSQVVGDLKLMLLQSPEFSDEVFLSITDLACQTLELAKEDSSIVKRLGALWLRTGSYQSVFEGSEFDDLDTAIAFVEDVLCYKLPWVINGMSRLLETQDDEGVDDLPDWFNLLPKYLRYGVDSKELAWIMSLGIEDRGVAEFLLQKYIDDNQANPASFRSFVSWAIAHNADLVTSAQEQWPKYFVQMLKQILDRYTQIDSSLGAP
ncbi:MAG: DEAD/DEAH box helicase [Anaerolineales bacterium]|nr:DEAD/DEAH box helicase [Anaerolineales bacterium]